MLLREMPASEIAKLAGLYALNQLSKAGGAFVPYAPLWQVPNQPGPKQ